MQVISRQTAAEDLELAPPATSLRRVTILGVGRLLDHEDVVANERGERNFNEEARVNPLDREADFEVERKCVGGEVAFEVDGRVTYHDDHSVTVEVNSRLYEGTGCETDDLEDSDSFEVNVGEGEIWVGNLSLLNTGAGGGDRADYELEIGNLQAP